MPTLRINNQSVTVEPGSTVLNAASRLGIRIPTLCHSDGLGHFTACMVCVVRNAQTGALIPACSVPAVEGLSIETDAPEVLAARRAAVELLLSEHVGDCEGPCRRACPAHMNIPRMLREITAGRWREAAATVRENIPLAAVLGRVCPAPCEKVCRRGQYDAPVAICLLKRIAGDLDLRSGTPLLPELPAPTGRKVAIVGAGPAGLASAWFLRRFGHATTVFDDHAEPGGALRHAVPADRLPRDVLDAETAVWRQLGVEFQMNVRVDQAALRDLQARFDAVVLAVGPLTVPLSAAFRLSCGHSGTLEDPGSHESSVPGVFVAGDALRPRRVAVVALASGKSAARAVHRYLTGVAVPDPAQRFNSQMGRLLLGEAVLDNVDTTARAEPAGGMAAGYTEPEAMAQARRCLDCDCRKSDACGLRNLASTLEAHQRRFKGVQRPPFRQMRSPQGVVFEPGKCIKCGLCVRLMEKAGARPGLAFLGRGADVEVGVPFRDDLGIGLGHLAAECVAICPTGALAFAARDAADRPRPPAESA